MKPWMWWSLAAGGVLFLLRLSKPTSVLFISRGGVSNAITPEFVSDTVVSATVRGTTPDVEPISGEDIIGWRI